MKSLSRRAFSNLMAGATLAGQVTDSGANAAPAGEPLFLWHPDAKSSDADHYIAFRGIFQLDRDAEIGIRTFGSSWYTVWLDGEYFTEGPARFPAEHPQYQEVEGIRLRAGRHILAVLGHHSGVETRLLLSMEPFFFARAAVGAEQLPIGWKATRLTAFSPRVRRVNPQLGWIEWCDTRRIPAGWQQPGFDDSQWVQPVAVHPKLGRMTPLSIGNVLSGLQPLQPVASGVLVETFGYEKDDIPARFYLRDLTPADLPPQGVWRRYDLGRVRLGRPRLTIDAPAGAVIEFAYAEYLRQGRVAPWITLSAGQSCNLDHYVARGGPQEFSPLEPRGGRYLEAHVLAAPEKVRFLSEEFVERGYYGPMEGAFHSGDELLDRIWMTGIETHRACSEDALIDNPTRERGQWTGDVVSVGLYIAAAGFFDLRLCRRALVEAAQCARADGLVAGLSPGGPAYFSSYAAQWTSAVFQYYELTGDAKVLGELYPAAQRNMALFEKNLTSEGISKRMGSTFIDWGYSPAPGDADPAMSLHYLAALRAIVRWAEVLERQADVRYYRNLEAHVGGLVRAYIAREPGEGGEPAWSRLGFHTVALALGQGLLEMDRAAAIAYLKRHILACFPNDQAAPRLSDPRAVNPRLFTPYFGHYVFPPLIENGEMDFVLEQYRKAWGWALGEGRTTWLEVFDTRWSHCHQWSGCPTWQLSRFALGLAPRFDLGALHYSFALRPGSLSHAEGKLPITMAGAQGVISVQWRRVGDDIEYELQTPVPIHLHLTKPAANEPEMIDVQEHWTTRLPRGAR